MGNIVRKLSRAILIPTKLGIIFVKIMASPEVERSPLTSPTNHQSRGYPKSQSHLSNSGEKRKMLNFRYNKYLKQPKQAASTSTTALGNQQSTSQFFSTIA